MFNVFWKYLLLAIAISGAALVSVPSAFAASKTAKVSKPQAAQTKAPNANWVALASSPVPQEKVPKVNLPPVPELPKVASVGKSTSPVTLIPVTKLEQPKLIEKVISTQGRVTPKAQLVADELESLPQVDVTPMQVLENTSSTPTASSTSPKSQKDDVDQVVPDGEQDDSTQDNPMSQVTSVSQLRDVQPTDWAFQALQSF